MKAALLGSMMSTKYVYLMMLAALIDYFNEMLEICLVAVKDSETAFEGSTSLNVGYSKMAIISDLWKDQSNSLSAIFTLNFVNS